MNSRVQCFPDEPLAQVTKHPSTSSDGIEGRGIEVIVPSVVRGESAEQAGLTITVLQKISWGQNDFKEAA